MSVKSSGAGSQDEGSGESGESSEGDGSSIRGCAVADWEPYFATLASEVYKRAGFEIDFPRAIFDSRARLDELASGTASAILNPGAPSCYIAEWELRAQAWLRAVGRGCVNLTAPILVWCQQAANYAPSTHECNSSGSWAD